MKAYLIETWWIFLEYLRFGFIAMFMAAGWHAWKFVVTGTIPSGEPAYWELGLVFAATLVVNRGTPWWRMARKEASR